MSKTLRNFRAFAASAHRQLPMLSIGRYLRVTAMAALCIFGTAAFAAAQDGWKVAVYPVLGWLPLGIDIDVKVPPGDGGGPEGGGGKILEGRFDGAYLGGVSAQKGKIRVDADFVWAAVGGDRPERPHLVVDTDVIYGHGNVGYKVAEDLFITAGVRRLALSYDITINDFPRFSRTPGLWDPLIGLGWHRIGDKLEWHGIVEGGGFGVGADVDFGAGLRLDWKPIPHFGITGGYYFMYLKGTDEVREREFTFKQTMHGPTLGIGFYF
jgi:hypothetical protein